MEFRNIDPTAANLQQWRDLIANQSMELRNNEPWVQDQSFQHEFGIELSKVLSIIGICKLGDVVPANIMIRFLSLEKLTTCLNCEKVRALDQQRAEFLKNLLLNK